MRTNKRALLLMLATCVFTGWAAQREPLQVRGDDGGGSPFLDTDGDLLPDHLEWVCFSDPASVDSDNDGVSDFLEVVRYTSPVDPSPQQPLDHEMRILVSQVERKQDSEARVWLHCLFRLANHTLADLTWFEPYIDTKGVRTPIGELFGRTPFRVVAADVPGEGTMLIVTLQLASGAEFARVLPCTVGARAVVGGRFFAGGTYVESVGVTAAAAALMPRARFAADTFLFQTLTPQDDTSPFFRGNKICEMELAVTGGSPGGRLCEVVDADCEPANGLRCVSTCSTLRGSMIFVPDGLGSLTGR